MSTSSVIPTNELNPSEVNSYLSEPILNEDANPLDYWKVNETTSPNLLKLAKHYLAIPASLGPVERLFSIAGKLLLLHVGHSFKN